MSGRILVVDDNRANLDLMLYLLQAFGHEAVGVSDGLAAHEAARAGDFALILTDILMPGIDGYELAARLKSDAALAATPLIAVTALAMAGDRERIKAAGFDGYIAKPIDPQTFVAQIESYLKPAPSG
jgi:two-component system, cell cycle response regulator